MYSMRVLLAKPVGGRIRKMTHLTSPVTLTPDALTHAVEYTVRRLMAAVEENFRVFVARKKLEYSLKFPFLKESQIVAKLRRIWTNQRANCSTASLSGKFLWFHVVWLGYCFFIVYFSTSYLWQLLMHSH